MVYSLFNNKLSLYLVDNKHLQSNINISKPTKLLRPIHLCITNQMKSMVLIRDIGIRLKDKIYYEKFIS